MPVAHIEFEPIDAAECCYPPPPYRFKGTGIALLYEIPFERVKGVLPSLYEPDPGNGTIWLKVNVYDWREFYSLAEPDAGHSYRESCYKFSVRYQSEVGDYPVKLYLDHDVPIVSGVEVYGLPKFRANLRFDRGQSGIRCLIERQGRTELDIAVKRAEGIGARLVTLFANATTGSYLKKYVGNILYQEDDRGKRILYTPTRIIAMKYQLARALTVYLREPLEWEIMSSAEMSRPKYAFILTNIEAELGPPKTVTL